MSRTIRPADDRDGAPSTKAPATAGPVTDALLTGTQAAGTGSALTAVFRGAGRPLLMPYAVGGYPDPGSCLKILRTYLDSGADLIEVGIPFSDPLADGPVIQSASTVALRRGVRPVDVLDIAATMAGEGARVVLLSYLNVILAFGPERFFDRCRAGGILGVVVPDVPVEEAGDLQATARPRGGRHPARRSHQHRRAPGPHRSGGFGFHLLRIHYRGNRRPNGAAHRPSRVHRQDQEVHRSTSGRGVRGEHS